MSDTPRTVTAPDGVGPPTLQDPDLITAIREYGRDVEYPLLPRQMAFTMGSSRGCDISVDSEYASSLHCVLGRRGQRVRVNDQASRNGTFFRGRRETTFDIGPGDTFMLASRTFLAVSERMQLARPLLAEVLGYGRHAVVDDLLVAAAHDGPLLIVGQKGSGQARLVRAVHDMSVRRRQALVEILGQPRARGEQEEIVRNARRGTLVVAVTGAPLDEGFLEMIGSAEAHIRLVALAPSMESAVESLVPHALTRMSNVELRPLRDRQGELETLIDRFFLENRASLCLSDLTPENREALLAYPWPENLDELRDSIAWIAGIVREGSIRKAAPVLNVARSSLQYWRDRLKLSLPLTRGEPSSEPGAHD